MYCRIRILFEAGIRLEIPNDDPTPISILAQDECRCTVVFSLYGCLKRLAYGMGWRALSVFSGRFGNKEGFWDFLCFNCLLVELILHIVHSACR
jgi:hypothetical protein